MNILRGYLPVSGISLRRYLAIFQQILAEEAEQETLDPRLVVNPNELSLFTVLIKSTIVNIIKLGFIRSITGKRGKL